MALHIIMLIIQSKSGSHFVYQKRTRLISFSTNFLAFKLGTYSTAQRQLESCEQTTRAVWNLYPRVRVCVQAHTHATSYLLRVISTNDKNNSLPSSILHVSLLVYTYTHIVKSQSRTLLPFYFAY